MSRKSGCAFLNFLVLFSDIFLTKKWSNNTVCKGGQRQTWKHKIFLFFIYIFLSVTLDTIIAYCICDFMLKYNMTFVKQQQQQQHEVELNKINVTITSKFTLVLGWKLLERTIM